jgi:glycine/D-amino acid oxidase-like deaminating enzyme
MRVTVVGAGIFGVTAALALRRRGHDVTLCDAGDIPHPLAESTDVSKAVRMDYGADEFYASQMERALDGWRAWNEMFGEELFHETGAMFVTREPMAPGGFEYESFTTLTRRGHALERLDARAIESRWSLRGHVDGYFNPRGGWAESGRVVARLAARARDEGVNVAENAPVTSIERVDADAMVIAAGSWVPSLFPEIAACFRTVGQPVFHIDAPDDVALPVFGADIARSGFYGFPRHKDGFVKIANHGTGRAMHPSSEAERIVTADEEARLRDFLRASLPALADAPIRATRVCVYCDTLDEHFWIAPHPDRPNLVVATGGSGHAFKFAPLLGDWIADALEGRVIDRFRWRSDLRSARGEEAARHH